MKMTKFHWLSLAGVVTVATAAGLTAYQADKQQYFNRDAAQNATDMISTLSCILNQTGASAEVKLDTPTPAYAVWVDEDRCRAGSMGSSDAGVNLSKYWVVQERTENSLRVKWWEYGDQVNDGRITYANAEIFNGNVGETNPNPYGVWNVDWCVTHLPADMSGKTGDDACSQRGHAEISADNAYRLFYKRVASGAIPAYEKSTSGVITQDRSSGYGKFTETLASGRVNAGAFGFVGTALKQSYNGAEACKNPVAGSDQALHQIWDGWLYDVSTQERITNTTGPFAVKRVSDGQVAWASHEGVRLTGASSAETSGVFVRADGSDPSELEAFSTAGVLIKRSPVALPNGLQDIDNLKLRFRVKRDAFASTLFAEAATRPTSPQADQYVVGYWSEAQQKLNFTGYDISASGLTGKYFKDFATPYSFSISDLVSKMQSTGRTYERSMWAFLMGSNQEYYFQFADPTQSPAAALASPLVYRLDQIRVVPGSADAPTEPLICIGKCPRPGAGSNGKHLVLDLDTYNWDQTAFNALKTYTFDAQGRLMVDGISVDYTDIDRNGQDGYREDLWLDRFIPASELSKLSCRGGTDYCGYDTKLPSSSTLGETAGPIMGVTDTYAWSTGPYRWTKFSGLKRADGSVVKIDQPLDLFYNVPDEAQYGNARGRRVALQYPGNGKLWMPGRCENIGGGTPTRDCSGDTEIYVNDFIIPFDSTVGKVEDTQGNSYLVKWTRQGVYYPDHSDATLCAASDVAGNYDAGNALTLPTSVLWTNPRDVIGEIPAGADPANPRYVGGVKTY